MMTSPNLRHQRRFSHEERDKLLQHNKNDSVLDDELVDSYMVGLILQQSAFYMCCLSEGYYSPLVLSPVGNLVVSLMCIRVSIRTHISVTAGRNFIMLGMMTGYDVGLMPVVSKC